MHQELFIGELLTQITQNNSAIIILNYFGLFYIKLIISFTIAHLEPHFPHNSSSLLTFL